MGVNVVKKSKNKAVFRLEVEYDTVPAEDHFRELIDTGRELGHVVKAELEFLEPLKRDMLNDL